MIRRGFLFVGVMTGWLLHIHKGYTFLHRHEYLKDICIVFYGEGRSYAGCEEEIKNQVKLKRP